MKEITRIHIAKIAYDIEPEAKKELTSYINQLEKYAGDKEVLTDIEIRITELLAKHGVTAGSVITSDDVKAVRKQLGEPSDFAPEGLDNINTLIDEENAPRRVYRDTSDAILGGVCSGLAKYFGIDVLWARLIFIVLLFGSFGTALIIYLILWAIIPPATTAAERLRMSGQPITLESIKNLGEQAVSPDNKTAQVIKNVLMTGMGIILILIGIGALVATISVLGSVLFGINANKNFGVTFAEMGWILVFGLSMATISGLLFASLNFVLANAIFRREWNKRILTIVIIIILAGILTFTTGIGSILYGQWHESARYDSLRRTTKAELPASFNTVKNLTVDGSAHPMDQINIEYIVTDTPRLEFESMPGIKPQISVNNDNTSAQVKLSVVGNKNNWRGNSTTSLKIYGPALENINLKDGNVHYYNKIPQDTLALEVESGSFTLVGFYASFKVNALAGGDINLTNAAIESLDVALNGGEIEAGVVGSLIVTQPTACPARNNFYSANVLELQAVSSGKIVYNGEERLAKSITGSCGEIIVGEKEYSED